MKKVSNKFKVLSLDQALRIQGKGPGNSLEQTKNESIQALAKSAGNTGRQAQRLEGKFA